MKTTRFLCSLLTIALLAAWGFAQQPDPSGGICVIGGLTREAKVQPGSKAEGKIILRNNGTEPREVKVYQTDYSFTADGTTKYGEPGSVKRSNSAWITFTPHQLTLAGNETAYVFYNIEVPKDEKLTGTYWSLIMVEQLPKGSLELPTNKPGTVNIGVVTLSRYAIQMVTHIGETGKFEMKFSNRKLLAKDDLRLLQVDIENTGERWMRPVMWVEIFDDKAMSVGKLDGGRKRVYPGCSDRLTVDLSQLPTGKYTALIVADNGDEHVYGTQCLLEIK